MPLHRQRQSRELASFIGCSTCDLARPSPESRQVLISAFLGRPNAGLRDLLRVTQPATCSWHRVEALHVAQGIGEPVSDRACAPESRVCRCQTWQPRGYGPPSCGSTRRRAPVQVVLANWGVSGRDLGCKVGYAVAAETSFAINHPHGVLRVPPPS